jgi:hypothetical protein
MAFASRVSGFPPAIIASRAMGNVSGIFSASKGLTY